MQEFKFSVVEIGDLNQLSSVPFVPGQYIIVTSGQLYYDPTTATSIHHRVCMSEGREGAVDQDFDGNSTNAQSGIAIEKRLNDMQTLVDNAVKKVASVSNPYGPTDSDQSFTDITWEQVENLISDQVSGLYRIVNKSEDGKVEEDGWAFYWVKDGYAYLMELRGSNRGNAAAPQITVKVGSAAGKTWLQTYPVVLSAPGGGLNPEDVGFTIKDLGPHHHWQNLWEVRDDGIYKYTATEQDAVYEDIPFFTNFLIVTNSLDTCFTYMFNAGGLLTVAAIDRATGVASVKTLSDVAFSGSYNDLIDTPELAEVATSGDYNHLDNKPIRYGTSDLDSTTTDLPDGTLYIVYEN